MPKVISTEFGAGGYINNVRKFGRVEALGAIERIVWDGGAVAAYDGWLADEEDISVVSSSEADKPGAAGVSYLQFTGQGNDGIEKTYSVTLNGTTPVLLSTLDSGVKFNTIYTAQCLNVEGGNTSPLTSAGAANSGTITITSVTTGKVMAKILPGLGRTQMMIWRCPADHFAEFEKISIYPTSGKPIVAKLMARDNITNSWLCVGQIDVENSIASITHPFPDYVSPGTDICLVVTPEGVDTNVSAQMWIEKKPIAQYDQLLLEGAI